MQPDRDAAARSDGSHPAIRSRERNRLVRIAGEFGDGTERAEAPLRAGIGDLIRQQPCNIRL